MPDEADHLIVGADTTAARLVEARLLSSLTELLPQSTNQTLSYSARDQAGELVGGLVGSTSYGWLLVKALWVAESCRGQGLGRRLVRLAEDEAIELGCHGAWLDTSNPGARSFYERVGYADFAELANSQNEHPASHHRWFMKKALPRRVVIAAPSEPGP